MVLGQFSDICGP